MPLATPVSNPGTQGQNMRYFVGPGSGLTESSPGVLTDGVYHYDSNGLSLDRPDSPVSGLPPANSGESYNVYTGQVSGGGGGGGGGDLLGTAMASPYYQQVLAANRAAEAAAAAARKAALQQMIIQFGLVPGGFSDTYGDIDATTRSLAEQNTQSGISGIARLKQALSDANRASTANLTAKGLRRSGARGYQLRKNQLGYDTSYFDALQNLLGNSNNLFANFAQGAYARQVDLASALANALNSIRYVPSGGGGGGGGGDGGIVPPVPSAPSYSAPGFQNSSYNVGQKQDNGFSINTGGGFYTNQVGGDLTSKWQRLAGM